MFPFNTIRSRWADVDGEATPAYAIQVRRYLEGLRLAGEPDHADEDADFRVPPDDRLHTDVYGFTPATVPRVTTVRTDALATFIYESNPIIVDTGRWRLKRSIPGSIVLRDSGTGGNYSDGIQNRLRQKMLELAGGDMARPVVAVGVNSERFDDPTSRRVSWHSAIPKYSGIGAGARRGRSLTCPRRRWFRGTGDTNPPQRPGPRLFSPARVWGRARHHWRGLAQRPASRPIS